jgi:hypothetical protein
MTSYLWELTQLSKRETLLYFFQFLSLTNTHCIQVNAKETQLKIYIENNSHQAGRVSASFFLKVEPLTSSSVMKYKCLEGDGRAVVESLF